MTKKVYINIDQVKNDKRAFFKYISSDRSDGKTTHAISMTWDNFHECEKIGVLSRRYTGDITKNYCETLLTNLRKVRECGDLDFDGSPKKDGVRFYEDGKQFALAVPLSRADSIKSALDVATHKNLYVDEYVPLTARYFKGEVEAILEIYRTIDRDTFTNDIYVFSNHITISNPIFTYFNIIPRNGISHYQNGRFVLLQVANKGNREAIATSPLGELTEGTQYYDYATGGTLTPVNHLIEATHSRERLPFVIECGGNLFGLYHGNDGFVLAPAEQRKNDRLYSTQPNGGKSGSIYLGADKNRLHAMRALFHMSKILADSETTLYNAADIWKMFAG